MGINENFCETILPLRMLLYDLYERLCEDYDNWNVWTAPHYIESCNTLQDALCEEYEEFRGTNE